MLPQFHTKALPCWIIFFVLVCLAAPACADFWGPPRPFETASGNGKFVAKVVPGDKKSKRASLEVFKVEDGKRSSQWKIELQNEQRFYESPLEAMITDDGRYAV